MLQRKSRGDVNPTDNSKLLKLRNLLNIIFMLGAIVGLVIYFLGHQQTGIIVILFAMVFKMAESTIRFFHK